MYLTKRALKVINNDSIEYTNNYTYSTFYNNHKSLKYYDIVKMDTMKYMFRARNNLLPFNLQTLYSIK